jgi:hypothetical protein
MLYASSPHQIGSADKALQSRLQPARHGGQGAARDYPKAIMLKDC